MSKQDSGRRVVLRQYPKGHLREADFAVESAPLPTLNDGEFRVRSEFISVDPMLRLFVDQNPLGGALPALPLGTMIPGAAVGRIVESRHPEFKVGEIVEGRFGWQECAVSNGRGVNRFDESVGPLEHALGLRGLPGFTAYVALEITGAASPNRSILVSGASGAVGSALGALTRARGGRIVGIVRGADKAAHALKLGYDAAIDRTKASFAHDLAEALPNGAAVYIDNVGGPLLADVLPTMARGGRILISGLVSQYQDAPSANGPDRLPELLHAIMGKGLTIESFTQYGRDALRPAFEKEMDALIRSGKAPNISRVVEGIENLPAALVGLFEKSAPGKVVVRVLGDR